MEGKRSSNAAGTRLILLILLIVLVAGAIIAAVILSTPQEKSSPRKLKVNTIAYEPVTDVEVARSLVVHPGAQLHGFRFRVDESIVGIHAYVEIWENGVYRGMSGATGGKLSAREGGVQCSFGMRDDRTGIDWCIGGQPPGATYRMNQPLPEGFVPAAWTSSALYQGDTGNTAVQAITPDEPVILAALAVSDTGSILGVMPEQLIAKPDMLQDYRYIQLLKCEFYTTDEWPRDELYLGVLENGKELHTRDISQLPERDAVENAIAACMMVSSAWPGRDVRTLPQAVFIRVRQPGNAASGTEFQEYYAFRLEDGTPVLQSQTANQFSVLDADLYVALLEAALRYTPE